MLVSPYHLGQTFLSPVTNLKRIRLYELKYYGHQVAVGRVWTIDIMSYSRLILWWDPEGLQWGPWLQWSLGARYQEGGLGDYHLPASLGDYHLLASLGDCHLLAKVGHCQQEACLEPLEEI